MRKEEIKQIMIEVTNLGLTDKASYHSYDHIYPEIIAEFTEKKLNILEIGTGHGGGLIILSKVFPDSNIYGIDYDYSILKIETENTNITLLKESEQTNRNIVDGVDNIDIVIEDASHSYEKSMITFDIVEKKLNKGAVYIIEDVYPEFKPLYQADPRFEVIDLTHIKNRGDDCIAVYRKK
jgi:predicted O-methyltransferase YrrM